MKFGKLYWALSILTIAAFICVDPLLLAFLYENKSTPFYRVMGRSFFEGSHLGVSDIPVFIGIGLLVIVILSKWMPEKMAASWVHFTKVWLASGLFLIVGLIHPLKMTLARLRPHQFESWKEVELGDWWLSAGGFFQVNPQKFIYNASFPSGHTAAMTLMFGFYFYFFKNKTKTIYSYLSFFLILGFCLAMAVARSMSLSHWPSDSVASLLIGMGVLYFCINELMDAGQNLRPVLWRFLKVTIYLWGIALTIRGIKWLYCIDLFGGN